MRSHVKVDLEGKVAFVTGSSAGIGKAIALELAKSGADIVLNGRHKAPAREVIEEISDLGRKVVFEKADVTDYREIQRAVDDALAKLTKIDILIASGGVRDSGLKCNPFEKTDPASFVRYAELQWLSRLYCARAVSDHMIARRAGKIIMITTDAGRWPTPIDSLASTAGAAIVMATKNLAKELGRWQIRVNAICLPPIKDTPAFDYATGSSAALARVFEKAFVEQLFQVTAADVAKVALFFSSDDSNAITGQILSVNGGLCFPG
jgi:3-oxoacyl-[acyl-carrier protein] reductase